LNHGSVLSYRRRINTLKIIRNLSEISLQPANDGGTRLYYEFAGFQLDAATHLLWRDGEVVPLTPRATELLFAMVEKPGDLIGREELLDRVWNDAIVEEGNLNFTISNLRKALGPAGRSLIKTIPRRGYRFTANVNQVYAGDQSNLIVEKRTLTETLHKEEIIHEHRSEYGVRGFRPSFLLSGGAAILAGLVAVAWYLELIPPRAASTANNIRSVAVLPLRSFNASQEDEALSFGIVDTLMTRLGVNGAIRVVSATDRRSEQSGGAPAVTGRQIGADAVIDGTLQRQNGNLRVTLRLIRSSDGSILWSDSFDDVESQIFRLQDAMAARTADALAWQIRTVDQKHPTKDRDAYLAYLRGRYFFDKRDEEGYKKAAAEFERAISLDPNYALAYSGLADTVALQANGSEGRSERDALYERSRALATQALSLDESSAEAHTSLGWVKRIHDWDWKGSESDFKRAIELDPNYVNARQWYAFLLMTLGRKDEALGEIEMARELAPLSKAVLLNYFTIRHLRGDDELLPALAEQITTLDQSEPANVRTRTLASLRSGDYLRVVEIGEAYRNLNGGKLTSDYVAANMAIAYARMGQNSRAEEMLDFLRNEAKTVTESAYRLAQAYAELGRTDDAIPLLQSCLAAHDDRLMWVKVDRSFESLRDDRRFREIVSRTGL
jgi:DNA-binding winged helix-turn-helix (wHTH) protein/TolB-like protein/Tfp pilus assembly protein PilF